MKVERVCTRDVVAVPRWSSALEAAESMRRFHVGALIVTEGATAADGVAGILTDRDLVVQVLAERLEPEKVKVEEVMSPVVASIPADAELHEALDRMRAAGVRRLLVTQAGGTMAGIVSLDDIVDGIVAELSSLAATVKNEIRREAAAYDSTHAAVAD